MLGTKILKCLVARRFVEDPLLVPALCRAGHTDIKVPDFTKHMRGSVAHPESKASDTDQSRKLITYVVSALSTTGLIYGAKAEVIRYVQFMNVSADVTALARIEINMDEIAEDVHVTFKWRGRPLFIWHRKPQAIEAVRAIPLNILRDPQRDEDRVQDPRFLVVLGVCTHLGCSPLPYQGDFGGYYCPCHGAHFDISGRARKGPAPTNMEVPSYKIVNNKLVVG